MLKRKEKNKRFNRIVNCTMLLQSEEQMLKKILLGHKMTGQVSVILHVLTQVAIFPVLGKNLC